MDAAVIPVARAWVSRAHAGSWVVSTSVPAMAAVSAFERPLPGLGVAGLTLTTVEAAVLAALVIWGAGLAWDRRLPSWRSPIAAPGVAVVAAVMLAALLAPEFAPNSFRFAGRFLAAALVLVLVQDVITSPRQARRLVATLLVAGALVGVVAVLELVQVPVVIDGLRVFRPGFHVVGGQVRATSTLFYPTITSMYLEVIFALGLGLLVVRPEPDTTRPTGPFIALTFVAAGIVATFTRAGLITMALSLLWVGTLRYARHRRWDGGHRALAALAAVVVGLILVSRSPQLLVTRLTTEGSQDWYGASYDVPETLRLQPGQASDIPVTLSNDGRLTWESNRNPSFALSYHWLAAGSDEVVIYDGNRTLFAQTVAPGDTVSMQARVWAPGYPGSYVLAWDVVHEHRTWLSTEGVLPGRTMVTVAGEPVSGPLATHGPMPMGAIRVPRLTLWTTALAISAEHPWFGIGPDNFRNVYGRYLGLVSWDPRVHANNTYLEALVGTGVVGLAAVLWLVAAGFRGIWQLWRRTSDQALPLVAATAAACVAIAVHGLVDSFITFTPTYVIFAVTAGLMFSPALSRTAPARHEAVPYGVPPDEVGSNAYRV